MQSVQETTEEILAGIRDPELRQAAADLKKAMDNNPRDVPGDVSEPQTAKIIQLPVWSESVRGTPNSLLRGALFSAIQSKDRRYMERQLVAAQDGIEIRYTGLQLNQTDLHVWEQVVRWAHPHPLGDICHFTAYEFLTALGRSTGGDQYVQLGYEISRLSATDVDISVEGKAYHGSLVIEGVRDEDRDCYALQLNPKILALWTAGWTAIDWKQRLKLRQKPLALWLHGFYASHAEPYPMRVETLMQLSGSANKSVKGFTQALKKALQELVEISEIRNFEIRDGIVFVDNVPSQSQQRHLAHAKKRHVVRDTKARR